MNRLVIVGCGRLAEIITNAVVKGMLPDYELVGVYSRTASKAEHIANKMRQHGKMCAACHTLKELLELKPDYLVESASPAAMKELALPTLENGTSIITLSIGALADTSFYEKVKETAKANDTRVYLVSGATGGFDVLRTTSLMGNATARFFNEKGPDALKGTSVYKEELQQERTHCLFRQCNRGNKCFSNQSKCICRSLIGFRRTGQYAGIHTVHPWIYR